jgi:hypothetical protein
VTHQREIVFVRERCWVVFDLVTGVGEHAIESRFQFAPGPVTLDGLRAHTAFPDANLLLWPSATPAFCGARIDEGQNEPRAGWYSDGYNRIEPAPALALTYQGVLPFRCATLLLPYRGTELPNVEFGFDGQTATIHLAEVGSVPVRSDLVVAPVS